MASVLDQILEVKRREVDRSKVERPQKDLSAEASATPRPRNFYKALTGSGRFGLHLIAEIKRASPSAGLIRPDFDPETIAKMYHGAGASALSVLTDREFFQGDLDFIRLVKEVVPLPVLRKDFIIDEYQMYESRAAGADAVLLIADVLPLGRLSDLMILGSELNLTCLVEVYQAEVLLKVRSMIGFPRQGYSLLGINNRDLATQKVDVAHTGRMVELIDSPLGVISESGVKSRRDIVSLERIGVSGVLIGETLMRADDPAAKIRELFVGDRE
jgi:indole-3-glycerol phosphate synthase